MNILILTSSYPPNALNATFMSELAESLLAKKISVIVLCPHQGDLPYRCVQNGVLIIRFPYWFFPADEQLGGPTGILPSIHRSPLAVLQMIPFCICLFLTTWRLIRNEKIELIHSHWVIPQGLIGAIIQFFIGTPHISSGHGTDIYLVNSYRIMHPLMRFIGKFSDCITSNSRYTNQLVSGVSPITTQLQIIPMGIALNEFMYQSTESNEVIHKEKIILFVGRLIPLKGCHILIEAISRLHRSDLLYKLIIIGDGPEKEPLKELANRLKVLSFIHFIGKQNRKALLSYYAEADLLVLPSMPYNNQTEGLGVVLLEAMAAGVPVIGSNTGGIPDIIEDRVNGLLFPPGDPDALAEAIIWILSDPELTNRIRKMAYSTVKEGFSWNFISEQFINVYKEALLKHSSNGYKPRFKANLDS